MTTLRDAALQALEGLIESARLLGATQAKKLYGCYSQEDGRLERAWHENIAKRSATIRAALAEPQPEPVASMADVDEYGPVLDWHKHWTSVPIGTRFYTHPPQRQPLTNKQIDHCWYQSGGCSLQFARAIERAHGIGGDK